MTTHQPDYDKLLDPITEVNTSVESLLDGAFGPLMGDQREDFKRIHANAWGLHTLFMDVVTNIGIENIAQRDYLERKFAAHVTPIVSNAQTLLDGVDGPLTDEQIVAVQFIFQTGKMLRGYVDDLWLYSQLIHGQIRRALVPIAVQDAIEPLDLPVTTHPVDLELLLPDDLPIVRGDALFLKRCVQELVSNAVQFTRSGSIKITSTVQTEAVCVCVQDTGIGISSGELKRIFDPFYQVRAAKADGIGLGLTLTRLLIELQGGSISLKSTPAVGTSAHLTIPLA